MDTEKLIDAVTKAIMERLNSDGPPAPAAGSAGVVLFGSVPADLLAAGTATRQGRVPSDVEGSQYIVMTIDAFRSFHGGGTPSGAVPVSAACCCAPSDAVDLTAKRVVSESDLRGSGVRSGGTVQVCPQAKLTALALDYAKANGIKILQ
jgi:hypothetical protein